MFPTLDYNPIYRGAGLASAELTDTSPVQVFTEPLTVAQVQKYLNLPVRWPPEPSETDLLSGMISGARAVAELFQHRDLVRKQWDYHFHYWPIDYYNQPIPLRDPLVSVELVQFRDSTGAYTASIAGTDYLVDTSQHPGIITPAYNTTWAPYVPWPSSSLLVRFTSGIAPGAAFWNDVGGQIRNGMLMLISAWFNNRIPYEPGVTNIGEYPFGITNLLSWGALNGGIRV